MIFPWVIVTILEMLGAFIRQDYQTNLLVKETVSQKFSGPNSGMVLFCIFVETFVKERNQQGVKYLRLWNKVVTAAD